MVLQHNPLQGEVYVVPPFLTLLASTSKQIVGKESYGDMFSCCLTVTALTKLQ